MTADTIPLAKPYFPEHTRRQIAEAVDGILASGTLMMGPWAERFEQKFAELTGRAHAVSVNSCTTALTIALMHADVKGREVLVPSGSFVTDVSAVRFAGGDPVLVDIDPETLALDPSDLERKLTGKTRALIWVHLTGIISSDHEAITDFARNNDLFLIEDASHAHGASVDGRPAGSFGGVSCFSFYPTKVLTCGTGGMLTTDDGELARYAREMRLFGRTEGSDEIAHQGNDWFLDEIRACVGYYHAAELEPQLARRRKIAGYYMQHLANQPGLRRLHVPDGSQPTWYQFPIFLDPKIDRQSVVDALKANHGVTCKGIYRPAHQERIFRELDDGTLTNTEDILGRSLCLPMFTELSEAQAERVVRAVIEEVRARLP